MQSKGEKIVTRKLGIHSTSSMLSLLPFAVNEQKGNTNRLLLNETFLGGSAMKETKGHLFLL